MQSSTFSCGASVLKTNRLLVTTRRVVEGRLAAMALQVLPDPIKMVSCSSIRCAAHLYMLRANIPLFFKLYQGRACSGKVFAQLWGRNLPHLAD